MGQMLRLSEPSGMLLLMQWWTGAPTLAFLVVGAVLGGPLFAEPGVYDEMSRIVGLLVPLVGALLTPLVAAIGYLFKILITEMRANREVVQANTAAFLSHTNAVQQLSQGIEGINHRLDDMAERIDRVEMDEGARKPRGARP